MKILILGVNGFIGNALLRAILDRTDWHVAGIDIGRDKLAHSLGNSRFDYFEGDICEQRAWVDRRIEESHVVLPLVAIATPIAYVQSPLEVFRLTFEENLRIIRHCASTGTRVVFPSSSEVYGLCDDEAFDEEHSNLVLGPISKQRWIYACSKQLLDRVIWAHGAAHELAFTLIRPFNWIGPCLDDPRSAKEGSSRVVTQFIGNLVRGEPIRLVDGGRQRRCFTYIDDGIDCLMRVIADEGGDCNGQIFNIGNPDNDCSMRELAIKLQSLYAAHPKGSQGDRIPPVVDVSSADYYGAGYQDMDRRKPSIAKARRLLGWEPRVALDEALRATLDAYLVDLGRPVAHPAAG